METPIRIGQTTFCLGSWFRFNALRSKAHRYHVACQRGTIVETNHVEARNPNVRIGRVVDGLSNIHNVDDLERRSHYANGVAFHSPGAHAAHPGTTKHCVIQTPTGFYNRLVDMIQRSDIDLTSVDIIAFLHPFRF